MINGMFDRAKRSFLGDTLVGAYSFGTKREINRYLSDNYHDNRRKFAAAHFVELVAAVGTGYLLSENSNYFVGGLLGLDLAVRVLASENFPSMGIVGRVRELTRSLSS